jgi:hypothetical protein
MRYRLRSRSGDTLNRFGTYNVAFAVIGLGLLGGLMLGLWVGWIVWPVQVAGVDVSDLKPASQDDYLVLTATDYAYDQDLARAQNRLAQLHDAKSDERLAALARQYAAQGNPAAAQLATLAIALGSSDGDIQLIATTATPTPSLTPTATETPRPTLTPILTPTDAPTEAPTRTPRPRVTRTPTRMPVADTVWNPAYPTGWPQSARFQPAGVAPGQKYWHLVSALYCDQQDTRNDCPNLPGGGKGTSIYVMLRTSDGGRATAALDVTKADGSRAGQGDIGPQKSPTDMCNCNYAWEADGSSIQVDGYPSDTIGGLALYSVSYQRDRFHVRYFVTFQLVTR